VHISVTNYLVDRSSGQHTSGGHALDVWATHQTMTAPCFRSANIMMRLKNGDDNDDDRCTSF